MRSIGQGSARRLAAATLALGCLVAAADEPRYFEAPELKRQLEEQVDVPVEFVDELVKIWKDQEVPGFVRFDSLHFRCLVPAADTQSLEYIRKLENPDPDDPRRPPHPLVYISGTPVQPDYWGGVAPEAVAGGVAPEVIVIKVDSAARPRQRYFDEWRQGERFH